MDDHEKALRIIFGKNLKKYREAANLSQITLGAHAGLTHNFINDIEHGKKGVSFETIAKLSEALEIEPYILFLGSMEKEIQQLEASINFPDHVELLLKAVDDFKRYYDAHS
jgi:transcriptional regulator with XRE-family HTH domain